MTTGTPVEHPDLFTLPMVVDPSKLTTKQFALYLAVMHHGFAALSERGVPTSKNTVTVTADYFYDYLNLSKP